VATQDKKVTTRNGVVYLGDWIDVLKTLPDCSVHMVCTSPPYYKLRNYGVNGQVGLEKTPELFVQKLVNGFREVRRVLRDDGVLFVNMGDSYASHGQSELKPKDLLMIPAQLAIALRANSWYLRSQIPWIKRSSMPDSTEDRLGSSVEYVFLLSKQASYYFDMQAVRRQLAHATLNDQRQLSGDYKAKRVRNIGGRTDGFTGSVGTLPTTNDARNFRSGDLWFQSIEEPHGMVFYEDEIVGLDVTSKSFKGAHFAVFPPKLVEPLILAGTSEKGCCPDCLAPWKRVLVKQREATRPGTDTKVVGDSKTEGNRDPERHVTRSRTLGWKPSCGCYGLKLIKDYPSKKSSESDEEFAGRLATWQERWEWIAPQYAKCKTIPCTVLDPFSGSGTSGMVSISKGRRYIGIELNPDYLEMSQKRLHKGELQRGLLG